MGKWKCNVSRSTLDCRYDVKLSLRRRVSRRTRRSEVGRRSPLGDLDRSTEVELDGRASRLEALSESARQGGTGLLQLYSCICG